MNPRLSLRFVAIAFAALLVAISSTAHAQALARDVRLRILQAVVEVVAIADDGGESPGAGSGTIVSADGFVLTNHHVIEDDRGRPQRWHAIRVTDPAAPDREPEHRYWARFVGGDAAVDLALLKIVEFADETPIPPGTRFVSLPIGEVASLLPGDPITVVGFPGVSGATVTFTQGIVSGFVGEDLIRSGKRWIKTDAKVARGNSGGGAFDLQGVLIGVPTLGVQTFERARLEGQDFLRPIDLAFPLFARFGVAVERVAAAPIAVAPAAPAAAPVGGPTRVAGSLRADTPTLPDGAYFEVHPIAVTAGAVVRVTLTSREFDPYLMIVDPDEVVIAEVDDAPGLGLGAETEFVATVSGIYFVAVTSAFAGEVGAYDLTLRGATPAGWGDAIAGHDLTRGDVRIDGSLLPGDETLRSGEFADVHEVTLRAGTRVAFVLASDAFDPYLIVRDPDGVVVLEIDDSPGAGTGVDAEIVVRRSGVHRVWVTSYRVGEVGGYRLSIRDLDR
jgi:S1-C subfamily serine protease